MSNQKDITGQKFNFLTALEFVEKKEVERKSGRRDIEYYWKFKCDCGKNTILRRDRVTTGKKPITSCGCQKNKCKWKGFGKISGSQWNSIKKNASTRNIKFELTIEEAWSIFKNQNECCALTGDKIDFSSTIPWYKQTTASLDRIDSNLNYTKDNVQWIHKDVNQSKWDFSTEKFIEICKKVYEYTKRRLI